MSRIPASFIDNVLARTDIVDVIGARLQLKRQGREFAACCPFHDERTPSFTVSPSKQFYHCFGCGAHGTAIRFVMDYERLSFHEAVEELAHRVGMEIPQEVRRAVQADESTQDLYATLAAATTFFQQQLQANTAAQSYLTARGVSSKTCSDFAIGYAPSGYETLKKALATDAQRLQLLERGGLFSKNDRGQIYDKFRDRIMFPIFDRRGRVIGFGGRVLDANHAPKYLNSPETPLFHKGRELYGLWQARQANTKLQRLIVVEGYMDVVALFQAGITQAVATLGTATTTDQAALLFRHTQDVYFCFDGDAAGQRAAWRALESVLPQMKDGRQAFFLFLPETEDPDSFLRKEGVVAFENHLAMQAVPLSRFFFDELSRDIQLDSLDGKARLAERARPLLAPIPEGAFAELMHQELTRLTGLKLDKLDSPAPSSAPHFQSPGKSSDIPFHRRTFVRYAITLLLQEPTIVQSLEIPASLSVCKQVPGVPLLLEVLDIIRQRPEIRTGAILEHFNDRKEQAHLYRLAAINLPGEMALWAQELHYSLIKLTEEYLQQRIDKLQQQLQTGQTLDAVEKYELRELLNAQQHATFLNQLKP